MTTEQINAYLNRMKIEGEVTLDAKGLDRLIWAHLTSVPFENIESFEEGKVPSLEIDDIYQKIVVNHRGGYCFELNKLFYKLLKTLGFDVIAVGVRIIWMREGLTGASHRASIVTIGNKKYLADVGYGGPGAKGVLELTTEEVQVVRGFRFRVIALPGGFYQIEREYQGGFSPMMYLEDREAVEDDFGIMNFYCAKCPNVLFVQKYVISLCKENGSIGLTGEELTIKDGDKVRTEIIDTEEKRKECLKTYFGIVR